MRGAALAALAIGVASAVGVHTYTAPLKGVIGIAVPLNHYSESRSFCPAENAASLSVHRFMVARMGERKLRRFTQVVPGTATHSSYRPQLQLGAVVVAKRTQRAP